MSFKQHRARFAVHPGWVTSEDGQRHYLKPVDLARLYGLTLGSYVTWDDEKPATFFGRNHKEYEHLYPREDGNYEKVATRRREQP